MKNKLRSIISVLFCCLLIFPTLTGCSRTEEGPKSVKEVFEKYLEENGESQYKGKAIKFKHFWSDGEAFFDQLCRDYSEILGVTVTSEYQPVATYLTSINTNLQTDSLPDVFTMWPGASLVPYISEGALANLNDVALDAKDYMSDYAREACTTNGGLYVLPVNNAFMGIAYNKEIFARNNLTVPTNIEDFENILATLQKDAAVDYPMLWGSDCSPNYIYLLSLSVVYDEYPDFNEKMAAGTISYDCEEMQYVYKKLFVDWADAGYYNASTANAIDRMGIGAIEFVDGNAAMMRIGSWDLNILNELNEYDTELGMFPMPGIEGTGNVLSAAGEAFALSNYITGDQKGAAVEFLNLISDPIINGEICSIINSLSPYSNVEMTKAPDMVKELSGYLNDKARGWNEAPVAMQNKMGECLDIVTASASEKTNVMNTHLRYLDRLWKEAL